jgi:hypothetical protein
MNNKVRAGGAEMSKAGGSKIGTGLNKGSRPLSSGQIKGSVPFSATQIFKDKSKKGKPPFL